jgi:hypothetical protein
MRKTIDFNAELVDINGRPFRGSSADEKQDKELRRLQMLASHRESSLESSTEALEALEKLRDETTENDKLGSACINALMTADDKADGVQVRSRMSLADQIQLEPGGKDFSTLNLNDDKRKMISDGLERAYAKKLPYVYFICYKLINGDSDLPDEKEEKE